jgi:hypothetical protein
VRPHDIEWFVVGVHRLPSGTGRVQCFGWGDLTLSATGSVVCRTVPRNNNRHALPRVGDRNRNHVLTFGLSAGPGPEQSAARCWARRRPRSSGIRTPTAVDRGGQLLRGSGPAGRRSDLPSQDLQHAIREDLIGELRYHTAKHVRATASPHSPGRCHRGVTDADLMGRREIGVPCR